MAADNELAVNGSGRDNGVLYPRAEVPASGGVYTPARTCVNCAVAIPGARLPSSPIRGYAALALRRPTLIPSLLRAGWRFRARDWWRRPPFLPLPPRAYMAWRNETAFGSAEVQATPDALARYLEWTETMRR